MELEFKTGDQVRFIEENHPRYTAGRVYEILSIEEDGGIWAMINDDSQTSVGWKPMDIPLYFVRFDEQQPLTEVEPMTAEEKLLATWRSHDPQKATHNSHSRCYCEGYRDGIERVLRELNITIEGIHTAK